MILVLPASLMRDNSSPSASSPTPFYEAFLDILSRVEDSALVCKTLYRKLLSIKSSPPTLPRQWSLVIGSGVSLDGHWSPSMRIIRTMSFVLLSSKASRCVIPFSAGVVADLVAASLVRNEKPLTIVF